MWDWIHPGKLNDFLCVCRDEKSVSVSKWNHLCRINYEVMYSRIRIFLRIKTQHQAPFNDFLFKNWVSTDCLWVAGRPGGQLAHNRAWNWHCSTFWFNVFVVVHLYTAFYYIIVFLRLGLFDRYLKTYPIVCEVQGRSKEMQLTQELGFVNTSILPEQW